jgi:hypothetical protein
MSAIASRRVLLHEFMLKSRARPNSPKFMAAAEEGAKNGNPLDFRFESNGGGNESGIEPTGDGLIARC